MDHSAKTAADVKAGDRIEYLTGWGWEPGTVSKVSGDRVYYWRDDGEDLVFWTTKRAVGNTWRFRDPEADRLARPRLSCEGHAQPKPTQPPAPDDQDGDEVDYTDGRWIATTMGQFIQILVDSGHDPAVIFRVDENTPLDSGAPVGGAPFVRKMTVYSMPNGAVAEMLRQLGIVDSDTRGVYKVLKDLIVAGLVS